MIVSASCFHCLHIRSFDLRSHATICSCSPLFFLLTRSRYNELVLTLPAADQRSIFQLWYLKLSFNAPMSTSVAESLPQDTGNSSSREEGAGRRVQTGDATRGEEVGTREVVAPPFWFTLSPAYIRWLMRLGTLCGTPGGDY